MYPEQIDEWPQVTVYGTDFRPSLINMAKAITELELWNWMKTYTPEDGKGFMFSSHPNFHKISAKVDSDGHSGATFAYAMRCMECIAKEGFESFSEFSTKKTQ